MAGIDPSSPTPLYLQIADAIRDKIRRGELAGGDALTPLREAAARWGVNVHTVRHAYTSLARDGLVESLGARGTRVTTGGRAAEPATRGPGPVAAGRSLEEIVDRAIDAARSLGIAPGALAAALTARAGRVDRPVVHIVECSAAQCESHAREVESAYDVQAVPWPLDPRTGSPPGAFIATYFHYNDIRRLWPGRLREAHFVSIEPDAVVVGALAGTHDQVRVCESDRATAEAIAADVSVLLGGGVRVDPVVAADPNDALSSPVKSPVLFPPRAWARLPARARADPRAVQLKYVIDPADLDSIARRLAWRPARGAHLEIAHAQRSDSEDRCLDEPGRRHVRRGRGGAHAGGDGRRVDADAPRPDRRS
ncbi:MAG: GntR family transcriptional regulator [Planctomycetota bacterium]|nr:MAG: GntR family transcriptional regulator [Planctomycetota bacterium]